MPPKNVNQTTVIKSMSIKICLDLDKPMLPEIIILL